MYLLCKQTSQGFTHECTLTVVCCCVVSQVARQQQRDDDQTAEAAIRPVQRRHRAGGTISTTTRGETKLLQLKSCRNFYLLPSWFLVVIILIFGLDHLGFNRRK